MRPISSAVVNLSQTATEDIKLVNLPQLLASEHPRKTGNLLTLIKLWIPKSADSLLTSVAGQL